MQSSYIANSFRTVMASPKTVAFTTCSVVFLLKVAALWFPIKPRNKLFPEQAEMQSMFENDVYLYFHWQFLSVCSFKAADRSKVLIPVSRLNWLGWKHTYKCSSHRRVSLLAERLGLMYTSLQKIPRFAKRMIFNRRPGDTIAHV